MSTQTAAALDAAQIAQYQRDGVLVVRGVFPNERIVELQADAERLLQRIDLIDTDNIRCC